MNGVPSDFDAEQDDRIGYTRKHLEYARKQRKSKYQVVAPFLCMMYGAYMERLRADFDWAIETANKRMEGKSFEAWSV